MPPDLFSTVVLLDQVNKTLSINETFPYSKIVNFRSKAFSVDRRRVYPGILELASDIYDIQCVHVVIERNQEIFGVARIAPAIQNYLPFSRNIYNFKISRRDFELSRFIIAPGAERRRTLVYTLTCVGIALKTLSFSHIENIYADVILGYPRTLNKETYIDFGFKSTSIEYYDQNYALHSEIFVITPNRRSIFFSKIDELSKSIGKIYFDENKSDFSIIRNKLIEGYTY